MVFSIALEYLVWHFTQMPLQIAKAWRNILLFNMEYFSLPLLLKTLFSPWRRIEWSSGAGFSIKRFFETFVSNLISRILGAIVRSFLIVSGILVEIGLAVAALLSILAWYLLPIAIAIGFVYGIRIIF